MIAHGFTIEDMVELVRAGLASVIAVTSLGDPAAAQFRSEFAFRGVETGLAGWAERTCSARLLRAGSCHKRSCPFRPVA
jgi:hypothetical protein